MTLRSDPSDPRPLYRQVADALRASSGSQTLRVPAVAAAYGVSLTTARLALRAYQRGGLRDLRIAGQIGATSERPRTTPRPTDPVRERARVPSRLSTTQAPAWTVRGCHRH